MAQTGQRLREQVTEQLDLEKYLEDRLRATEESLDMVFELAAKVLDDATWYRREYMGQWAEDLNGR